MKVKDLYCQNINGFLQKENVKSGQHYFLDGNNIFVNTFQLQTSNFNSSFITCPGKKYILNQAHNACGQNKTLSMYHFVKGFFIGMPNEKMLMHTLDSVLHTDKKTFNHQQYAKFQMEVLSKPMHSIAMGLVGRFPPSFWGHQYTFTIICLFTDEVVRAYINSVMLDSELHWKFSLIMVRN